MVKYHARLIWTLLALFTFCSVHGAWAGPPTDSFAKGSTG